MTDKQKASGPDAAQPDLTQQTLDDVKAGIPARDAEIEALRKENAELRQQLEAIGAGGVNGKLMPGAVSAEPVAWQYFDNGRWYTGDDRIKDNRKNAVALGYAVRDVFAATVAAKAKPEHFDNKTKMVAGCCGRSECGGECGNDWVGMVPAQQPVSGAEGLTDAVRVPLDSLHADAVYLLSRVKQETLSIHDAALSIQHHIDSARAALAEQDADKVDALNEAYQRGLRDGRREGDDFIKGCLA